MDVFAFTNHHIANLQLTNHFIVAQHCAKTHVCPNTDVEKSNDVGMRDVVKCGLPVDVSIIACTSLDLWAPHLL